MITREMKQGDDDNDSLPETLRQISRTSRANQPVHRQQKGINTKRSFYDEYPPFNPSNPGPINSRYRFEYPYESGSYTSPLRISSLRVLVLSSVTKSAFPPVRICVQSTEVTPQPEIEYLCTTTRPPTPSHSASNSFSGFLWL